MQTLTPRSIAVFFISILTFVGTVSCQRASTAYLAPTYHPAAQRLAVNSPVLKPSTDSLMTASIHEAVPLSTKPVWESSPESVPASAVESTTGQPSVRHQSKRMRL